MHCAADESAARPALEVARIARTFGEAFRRAHKVTPDQAEVLRAILACRTPALGGHFHVVFTVPDVLHRLSVFRREPIFDLIFAAASQTLAELAKTHLAAELGMTMVLHTWTRDLRWHPHVHAIVTAGGLSLDAANWRA